MGDNGTLEFNPLILYQWPGSNHCDSIYVRCTKLRRMLLYFDLPHELHNISLPRSHNKSEISEKINPLMRKIPILKIGETLIQETSRIVNWIVKQQGLAHFANDETVTPSEVFFLNQWAEHWLVWHVIHARFKKEDNFKNFCISIPTVGMKAGDPVPHSMEYTRDRACQVLAHTELGSMTESQCIEDLYQGCDAFDQVLATRPFAGGAHPFEVDFSLYMSIQALNDPCLVSESGLIANFSNINRWYRRLESLTQNDQPTLDATG